jgi:hypothetical protein
MPKSAAKVVLQVLKKMEYFVRTAYGTSPQAYSNAINWILGIIQGSGHSCPSWGLTSSVMLDQMEQTPGATFHSPRPNKVSRRTGEVFIDDTTLMSKQQNTMSNLSNTALNLRSSTSALRSYTPAVFVPISAL